MRLKGKIAIVTGAGGGMGRGICACLAREGADVVASDMNLDAAKGCVETLEAMGQRGLAVRTDVTNEEDCQNLVDTALEAFGVVDILVNNAGHFGEQLGLPFTNQTEADWDDNYAVNVKGPFFLCKAVAAHMMDRKYGKIINISSIAAKRDPQIAPAYAAAKNALLNLTRLVAKDLGAYNINVNAVCPGLVWTAFWQKLAPLITRGNPAYANLAPRELFEEWVKHNTPLQREQTPEDIGNLVVFLASEEARNITGQSIHVDGGICMG